MAQSPQCDRVAAAGPSAGDSTGLQAEIDSCQPILLDRNAEPGWYLLRGRLLRRGGAYDARLYMRLGSGWVSHDESIPASSKGLIEELVYLPAAVCGLALSPGPAAHVDFGGLRLSRVNCWQRRLYMVRRLLIQWWVQPLQRRASLALTWPGMLRDLDGAYKRAGRLSAHAAAPTYSDWRRQHGTLRDEDRRAILAHIAEWRDGPTFLVLLVTGSPDAVRCTLASLDAQLYGRMRCVQVSPAGADAGELDLAAHAQAGDWVVMVRAGETLEPHALYMFAWAAKQSAGCVLLYADEDCVDETGESCDPQFKPQWSWSHARSTRFMGEAVAVRADALALGGGLLTDDLRHGCYDLVLRTLDAADPEGVRIRRICAVLLHRPLDMLKGDAATSAWAMAAVRTHLARRGLDADVEQGPRAGTWHVRYALPAILPLVSVIVPTRDALALTRRCIESLIELTAYPAIEVVLVDNQTSDPAALEWMREQERSGAVSLLHYDRPFNYSAINNMAVRAARGDLVCLLNNDTEITHGGWLREMVAQLQQPGVDVVGAKLLYADGRVQHAGDVLGVGGVANHAHAWVGGEEPGYCGRALVAQEYSAVTGACLLTRRSRYLALGGLDERNLPVAFNDVDYCLRVREAGGRVVWTPHAVLVHHESVTRRNDTSAARRRRSRKEAAYMRKRWGHVLADDPFYHPGLNRSRADFTLEVAPHAQWPWRT